MTCPRSNVKLVLEVGPTTLSSAIDVLDYTMLLVTQCIWYNSGTILGITPYSAHRAKEVCVMKRTLGNAPGI